MIRPVWAKALKSQAAILRHADIPRLQLPARGVSLHDGAAVGRSHALAALAGGLRDRKSNI
jgi:hypothetical protein